MRRQSKMRSSFFKQIAHCLSLSIYSTGKICGSEFLDLVSEGSSILIVRRALLHKSFKTVLPNYITLVVRVLKIEKYNNVMYDFLN